MRKKYRQIKHASTLRMKEAIHSFWARRIFYLGLGICDKPFSPSGECHTTTDKPFIASKQPLTTLHILRSIERRRAERREGEMERRR